MTEDDRQILLRMHRGHEASARALWSAHAPRMLAFARAIVRPRDAADDVVQSVFCGVLALPASRVAEVADPASWLIRLTRHASLNFIRSSRRSQARDRAAATTAKPTPSRRLDPVDGDAELAAALELLPRRQREVLVLKHVAGLSFDQIAAALGANRNTVAGRYRSGLAALRDRLNPGTSNRPPRSTTRTGVQHV